MPRIWLVPLTVLTALLAFSATGVLSRSLVLDLVAWWPFWSAIALLAIALRGRKIGKVRLSGVVPLIALVTLITMTIAHLGGWEGMPSSEGRLVGPNADGIDTAELSARVDGRLVVNSGSEFLYEVAPVRWGGSVALPQAVERSLDNHTTIDFGLAGDPGFYGFAGWEVMLSTDAVWDLSLEGDLDVDLTGLTISEATLSGSGLLSLDHVGVETHISLNGDFELVVAEGTPVRVVGDAEIPDSWDRRLDGWASPVDREGWVIELSEASSLRVVEG